MLVIAFLFVICLQWVDSQEAFFEGKESIFFPKINPEDITEPWEDYRLTRDVIPLTYYLYLYPNMDTDTFTGKVNIVMKTIKPTDVFILHAKGIQVNSKIYQGIVPLGQEDGAKEMPILKEFAYEANDFWVAQLTEPAPSLTYTWHLEFSGDLKSGGITVSSYIDSNTGEAK